MDRIDQRHLSRPTIRSPRRCRAIGVNGQHGPATFGCDRPETLDLIVGGKRAIRTCSGVDRDANSHGQSISRILILTSELIEPPPPIVMLVETARSLQLAEPTHDEFLRVEMHGLTWTSRLPTLPARLLPFVISVPLQDNRMEDRDRQFPRPFVGAIDAEQEIPVHGLWHQMQAQTRPDRSLLGDLDRWFVLPAGRPSEPSTPFRLHGSLSR